MPSVPFVQNRSELLKLHNLGAAYGQRPSAIARIEDEWAAFQLDSACLVIGRKVENALRENEAKDKKSRLPVPEVIRRALGQDPGAANKQEFGNLGDKVTQVVKIGPDEDPFEVMMRGSRA